MEPCADSRLRILSACTWRHVHHPLLLLDNLLIERQALTLDYSHAEEAALGLAARASRVLTGLGLSHPLCTHTQAGLRAQGPPHIDPPDQALGSACSSALPWQTLATAGPVTELR
ncbi:unnamed protein product [Pleuronectes platessa]|uniref:Uncharacterized protein n=1 Tax=Pleuronectes platessa TaxID=8262 RepID=A0A9N7U4F8_PLEPL|nr:unnamed protein product [Pleuronectes platessa]